MGARPNVKVYPAVKVKMSEVHKGGWSTVTHMTSDDMCAFARDLFDAAHNTGSGAARMVHDFGLGIVCLGWTPEGIKANAHRGLALFKELTAALFREHFDVTFKPQLGLLQEAAWRLLDAKTKREYMMCAISGADGPVRRLYTENHPAFVLLLERQTAPAAKRGVPAVAPKKRAREGEGGSSASSA
jgi:hypothetical protein